MRRDSLISLGAMGALVSAALTVIALVVRFLELRADPASQQVLGDGYGFTLAAVYLFAGFVALALWRLDTPPTTRSTVSSLIGGLGAEVVCLSFIVGELSSISSSPFARIGQIAMGLWLIEANWRLYRKHLLSANMSAYGAGFGVALVTTSIGVWLGMANTVNGIALLVTLGLIGWQGWLGITLLRRPAPRQMAGGPRPPLSAGSASSLPGHGGDV